ncbi:uncharacterized protein K444DRAFT_715763 [Hyaloscypha bicolor E]|uniref:Uncharacterized protein n=1 Tax=Hyaloscypha bicolor E TaxID=1095630 RepID=A0A2J6TL46_9HELO|nr:uncharacterized protein K444DRAFT_715763 [Hyaloscypha bicolor E]PMD63727.1 hypothetical protein K444DRAFT_715763 [Hyaloscypha bicolor E]
MYPLLIFFPVAKGLPLLQNITIPLPNGSSDHENPGLLCTPTKWSDIIIFYLANYAAHAATTRSLPGEKTRGIIMVVLTALFFPAAGAFRGILGITSLAIWAKTDLEMAAKAGALCMVVRGPDWEPRDGDTLENTILCLSVQQTKGGNSSLENPLPIASSQENAILGINTGKPEGRNFRFVMYDPPWNFTDFIYGDDLSQSEYQIHGNHHLPPGYCISLVPRNATFIEPPLKRTTLSYNYNWVKVLVSLGQAIYTIFTLYQARGDQIERFGYAAFGLTVAPYAVVSVLNLLGSGLCPEFAALYMVESSIMKEAVKRGEGCFFMGTVGELGEDIFRRNPSAEQGATLQVFEDSVGLRNFFVAFLFSFLATLVPVAIIGGLSKFHRGHSTHAQRVWIMTWLSFGAIGPFILIIISLIKLDRKKGESWITVIIGSAYIILFYAAPAIGGFVVIGQMLRSFGTCITIS